VAQFFFLADPGVFFYGICFFGVGNSFSTLFRKMKSFPRALEAKYAHYRGVYADRLETCTICLEPISHLSLVMVCVHGQTSHAVHHACGQGWYTDPLKKCSVCGTACERRYTALAYCLRVTASITVNRDTMKDLETMDALKRMGRTLLGIYMSKNVKISPTLSLGSTRRIPPHTAEIEVNIDHASFGRIYIPPEMENDKWYLSQHQQQLVLVIKDGISTHAEVLIASPRKPQTFISVTELLEGVFYPNLVNPNVVSANNVSANNIRTQFKNDPFQSVELHGNYYDLQFPTFELERESQTQNIYTNEGLDDLITDEAIKAYLDGIPSGPFTLLFADGKEREITLLP
jgi:hypothetical protein